MWVERNSGVSWPPLTSAKRFQKRTSNGGRYETDNKHKQARKKTAPTGGGTIPSNPYDLMELYFR